MYIDPLLNSDSLKDHRFWAGLGKHIPAATNTHATTELLLETECFYVVRAQMSSAKDKISCYEFCAGGCENSEKGLAVLW
jgi:hypothetical protein